MSADADTIREALIHLNGFADALAALDRLAGRIAALEQGIEQREEMATHWLARANELELEELPDLENRLAAAEAQRNTLAEALDWIEAEPEDPIKVQMRARAALAAVASAEAERAEGKAWDALAAAEAQRDTLAKAVAAFVATTSVFRQNIGCRDEFEAMCVALAAVTAETKP